MEFKPVVDVLTDAITKVQADGDVTIHGRGDGCVVVRHTDGEEVAIWPTELVTAPAEDTGDEKFPPPEGDDAGDEAAAKAEADEKARTEAEAKAKADEKAAAEQAKGGRSKS